MWVGILLFLVLFDCTSTEPLFEPTSQSLLIWEKMLRKQKVPEGKSHSLDALIPPLPIQLLEEWQDGIAKDRSFVPNSNLGLWTEKVEVIHLNFLLFRAYNKCGSVNPSFLVHFL